jgi:hypothetical protein
MIPDGLIPLGGQPGFVVRVALVVGVIAIM